MATSERYMRKAIVVDAIQMPNAYDPTIEDFIASNQFTSFNTEREGDWELEIVSASSTFSILPGEWLIRQPDGALIWAYATDFEANYHAIEDIVTDDPRSIEDYKQQHEALTARLRDQDTLIVTLQATLDSVANTALAAGTRLAEIAPTEPEVNVSVVPNSFVRSVSASKGCGGNCMCKRNS